MGSYNFIPQPRIERIDWGNNSTPKTRIEIFGNNSILEMFKDSEKGVKKRSPGLAIFSGNNSTPESTFEEKK